VPDSAPDDGVQFAKDLQGLNPGYDVRLLGQVSSQSSSTAASDESFGGHADVAKMARTADWRLRAQAVVDLHGRAAAGNDFGFSGTLNLDLEAGRAYLISRSHEEGKPADLLVFASLECPQ
jgi:hypothetical protein